MDNESIKRALLEDFRADEAPPADAAAQNWQRLNERAAAGDTGPSIESVGVSTGVKVGVGVALAAALAVWWGSGAQSVGEPAIDTPPVAASVQTEPQAAPAQGSPAPTNPTVVAPTQPTPPDEASDEPTTDEGSTPEPAPSKPRPKTTKKTTSKPAPAAGKADLDAEIALLAAGKRALGAGDASDALRLAKQHAREFPRGSLADERELLRVEALCGLGKVEKARATADGFLRKKPKAAISAKMRKACR